MDELHQLDSQLRPGEGTDLDGMQHVVGESNYQATLLSVRDRISPARTFRAELRPAPDNPHDPNAVIVLDVETGSTLGYLPRHVAARIDHAELGAVLECDTKLIGGSEGKPSLGVMVDFDYRDFEVPTSKLGQDPAGIAGGCLVLVVLVIALLIWAC